MHACASHLLSWRLLLFLHCYFCCTALRFCQAACSVVLPLIVAYLACPPCPSLYPVLAAQSASDPPHVACVCLPLALTVVLSILLRLATVLARGLRFVGEASHRRRACAVSLSYLRSAALALSRLYCRLLWPALALPSPSVNRRAALLIRTVVPRRFLLVTPRGPPRAGPSRSMAAPPRGPRARSPTCCAVASWPLAARPQWPGFAPPGRPSPSPLGFTASATLPSRPGFRPTRPGPSTARPSFPPPPFPPRALGSPRLAAVLQPWASSQSPPLGALLPRPAPVPPPLLCSCGPAPALHARPRLAFCGLDLPRSCPHPAGMPPRPRHSTPVAILSEPARTLLLVGQSPSACAVLARPSCHAALRRFPRPLH